MRLALDGLDTTPRLDKHPAPPAGKRRGISRRREENTSGMRGHGGRRAQFVAHVPIFSQRANLHE